MPSHSNASISIDPYAHLNLNEAENRIAAIIFLFVILAGVIPYFPVLIVFIKNHHFNRHISYQIMIHIGVMDLFVQFGYLVMSIMMLTNDYFGHVFARCALAVPTGAWYNLVWLTLILSINRGDTFTNCLSLVCVQNRNKFFKRAIVFSYIVSFIVFVLYMIPGFGGEKHGMTYIRESLNNSIMKPLTINSSYVIYGISYGFYLLVVGSLIKQRLKTSNNKTVINASELRLLIQAFIICGYKSLFAVLFGYYIAPTKTIYIVVYSIYIFETGYNPYLYYMMNKRLRKEINSFLWKSNSINISVTPMVVNTLAQKAPRLRGAQGPRPLFRTL